ncbi:TFAM family protein [Megaselia abdita]
MISLSNALRLCSISTKSSLWNSSSRLTFQVQGVKTLEEKVGLPPKPKKPLTPYFRYMKDSRETVRKENPEMSIMDLTKLMSKQWETVEEKTKTRYMNDFKKDQIKYVEERAKYDSKITDEQRQEMQQIKQDKIDAKQRKAIKQRVKELGRPKRPTSAFLRFVIQERVTTPQSISQTYRQWHAKATEKWTRMPEADKEAYILDARKDYETYKSQIKVWEEKMIKLGHMDVVRSDSLIDPPEPKPRKNPRNTQ